MTTVSPEVIEKWRSDFEDYRKGAYSNPDLERMVSGRYRKDRIQSLFEHWVAARQSAVIELPENNSCYDVVHDAIEEIADAIKAQGYQVNFNQPTQG